VHYKIVAAFLLYSFSLLLPWHHECC